MAAKKILFLHHGGDWLRGSEKVLLGLLGNLDKTYFETVLACNHEILAAEAAKLGIRTCHVEWPEFMIDKKYFRLQFFGLLKTISSINRLVRNKSIDILVSNGGLPNQVAYYAAKLAGVPSLSYLHAPYNKRYIYLYRLNHSDSTIFVSDAIRNMMAKKADFKDGVVIHNGIDTGCYHPVITRNRNIIAGLKIDENKTIIGQVGSLIHRKGIDTLIEASRLLVDRGLEIHIVLVGDGPDAARFTQMVTKLALTDYFTFFGNSDVPDLFYKHIFDINVLASRSEAFGLTIAEGAACGLPCVGADVDGIPEVMRDNETGFLFRTGDPTDLADKLETLVKNKVLRKEMGEKGRQLVESNFTLIEQVRKFSDVLSDLVSSY